MREIVSVWLSLGLELRLQLDVGYWCERFKIVFGLLTEFFVLAVQLTISFSTHIEASALLLDQIPDAVEGFLTVRLVGWDDD